MEGRSYPARIIGIAQNNIICELAGYVFPIRNLDICYSRRPDVINKAKYGDNGYIYVWVKKIEYDKKTQELKCEFTSKNPYETDCGVFIRNHGCRPAHSTESVRGSYSNSSMTYAAEIVTIHTTGLYCELIDHPGVQVSCRYSDYPAALHIKNGDQIKVRVSNYYRTAPDGQEVLLGRIDRVLPSSRNAILF